MVALVLAIAGLGCGNKRVEEVPRGAQGDERLLELGRLAIEDKDWTEARGFFQQLLDSYPRSQLAGDARLGIADSYYNQSGSGNLILAIAEYRDFLTFFPNHPRADYAQYQIAYGHYRQIHSPDRDQEPTKLAIEEFETLIRLYRNSRYAEEGQELLAECRETLAEAQFRKGWFYLDIRKHCRAAIGRFTEVLEEFPSYSKRDEVHFRLGSAYQMCLQLEEAQGQFRQVIDEHPDSTFREEAQSILGTLQAQKTESSR
jgi:outer membrane protein assembly factor BamD